MIDFNRDPAIKLKQVNITDGENLVRELLIDGERVLSAYRELRDYVVFTDKRIIAVNVQKLTGKKKDFTTLPYSKISVYSVETAGVMDIDSELDLWYSGLGHVRFEFTGRSDIVAIGKLIATYALR